MTRDNRLNPDRYLEQEFVKAQLKRVPSHPDPVIADILDRLQRIEVALFGKSKETR